VPTSATGGGLVNGQVDGHRAAGLGISRETAYADHSALGYTPDGVAALTGAVTESAARFEGSGETSATTSTARSLSPAKQERLRRAREVVPTGPGMNIEVQAIGKQIATGRILFANFDVNSAELKLESLEVLAQIAELFN
jgi:hypothetical protein